uniref:Minor tail protein n=1 Tax=Mycobacterium phage BabyBack TaxID=3158877 RepID=A0AAU8GQY8_9CAUD
MYEEQDHEFFDTLYQQWSKTTMAEHGYWMPEEDESFPGCFNLIAVHQSNDERKPLAAFMDEADAEFVAGLHGAVPDLIRRLHEAIDEAVSKDEANDIAQGHLADALLENQALREQIRELERRLDEQPDPGR